MAPAYFCNIFIKNDQWWLTLHLFKYCHNPFCCYALLGAKLNIKRPLTLSMVSSIGSTFIATRSVCDVTNHLPRHHPPATLWRHARMNLSSRWPCNRNRNHNCNLVAIKVLPSYGCKWGIFTSHMSWYSLLTCHDVKESWLTAVCQVQNSIEYSHCNCAQPVVDTIQNAINDMKMLLICQEFPYTQFLENTLYLFW